MAETAADIGKDFSDYRGDPALGGSGFGVIDINTKPLDQLGIYTMLSNQVMWKQKKQETDLKVAQLADLSKISLNDLRGKDKEQATKEFTTLIGQASEYARTVPKNETERIQSELKWQTDLGRFNNNYNSGKKRAISYVAHYNTIKQNIPNADTQNEAIKQLDRSFDGTDIGTPISAMPNFKMEKFDIPEPVAQPFDIVAIGGNQNVNTKGSVWVPARNAPVADATILEIGKSNVQKGSPEYNALSQNEKDQADLQATVQSSGKGWLDAAVPLNEALKKYTVNGEFKASKFEEDNASNTTLMNAYSALKNMSTYSSQKKNEASNGVFNDKGLQVQLPQGISPTDFNAGIVDFANGVNPTQLVMSGAFAKYKGDNFTKAVTPTDNAIQMANLSKDYSQLNETIRHNKAEEGLRSTELKDNVDKWKAAQVGGQTQINGAMERAKRIYGDLLKLADKNGVIPPEKTRLLNTEQLKYLGIEKPVTSASGTMTNVFQPLTFSETDANGNVTNISHAIQLVNGEVRVLSNAEPIPGKDANGEVKYKGQFDREKSTNLFNIGTNILNEELKTAGSKELNSYMGVDVTGGVTSSTSGGSTSASGATQTQTQQTDINSLDPNGFKKEGKNYRYKDGTLYDAKGNIIK